MTAEFLELLTKLGKTARDAEQLLRGWTSGQVGRMSRTIEEATVKRFHYDTHHQFETHFASFVSAYRYGRRLNTLRSLTPHGFICKC